MTVKATLKELEALGDEKRRKHNAKFGAGDNQFGVKMGDIRKIAKKIKTNHDLALELWDTGNVDAQFLAVLIMDSSALSAADVDRLVRSSSFVQVSDWLYSYVIKTHSDKEKLRQKWMKQKNPLAARAGWAATAGRVAKEPDGIDIPGLLDRLEAEMGEAPEEAQWTMNICLVEIGINHAKYRKRALAIGEKLGVYRDFPTAKGCTSPFAPIWINEIVSRQG